MWTFPPRKNTTYIRLVYPALACVQRNSVGLLFAFTRLETVEEQISGYGEG